MLLATHWIPAKEAVSQFVIPAKRSKADREPGSRKKYPKKKPAKRRVSFFITWEQ